MTQVKRLPKDFLLGLGMSDVSVVSQPAISIPYLDRSGELLATRFRTALTGDNRFRWRNGSSAQPYGLWRLPEQGYVILVRSESDAQTLWWHRFCALCIPGDSAWRSEWVEYLMGLQVYVWQGPGRAGPEFVARIGAILPDIRVLTPPQDRRDISDCHLLSDNVPTLIQQLMASARSYRELQEAERQRQAQEAHGAAMNLLHSPDILAEFERLCHRMRLVGEDRNATLLYLIATSRLLKHPISVLVKGQSSSGKSFQVETVLKAFPESAYYALSSMSDKALVYSEEPLTHRMLVLYEIAGINGEVVEYFLRSLLSEGRVRHETVVKTRDDQVAKLFEREGPTGLIVTTTLPKWHAENETRMFSLTTRDDPEQTRSVLLALGSEAQGEDEDEPDLAPWHALQKWLELAGARDVELPFAASLARVVDCNEIRMRRDFTAIINLIRAHAILHQCNRRRDDKGRIVATLDDYAAIHELVADLVGEGVHAGVNPPIREIVMAVTDLQSSTGQPVSQAKLGTHLSLGKSVVSRRVKVAIEDGYLENLEMDRGRPAKLIPGLPLPDEQTVLPSPETLQMGEGVAA